MLIGVCVAVISELVSLPRLEAISGYFGGCLGPDTDVGGQSAC